MTYNEVVAVMGCDGNRKAHPSSRVTIDEVQLGRNRGRSWLRHGGLL